MSLIHEKNSLQMQYQTPFLAHVHYDQEYYLFLRIKKNWL